MVCASFCRVRAIVATHFAASKPGPSGLAWGCGHQRDVPAARRVLAVGRAVERAQREIERLVERLQVVQDDSLSQRPRADVDGADVQGLHAGPGGYRPGDDLPAAGPRYSLQLRPLPGAESGEPRNPGLQIPRRHVPADEGALPLGGRAGKTGKLRKGLGGTDGTFWDTRPQQPVGD